MTALWTPPGTKAHCGRERWPLPDVLRTSKGWTLDSRGEGMFVGEGNLAKVFYGPHGLTVLVSLDPARDGLPELLHLSLSLPEGYPDWDLIYAVTRAVFGEHVDAMMPLPREEAYIHGGTPSQRKGQGRQVFHCFESPVSWPKEG